MQVVIGNVLDIEEGIIVHGCNAQGVMNSGIAKEVRIRYPDAFEVYRNNYEHWRKKGYPHAMVGSVTIIQIRPGVWLANAITQQYYGRNPNVRYVSYSAVEHAFCRINTFAAENGIDKVCFPKIGAGLGNGDWEVISTIIETQLTDATPILYLLE